MERWVLMMFCVCFGAAMGSFLNVVAERSCVGRQWWGSERSRCSSCGQVLRWSDLVPVVSWIALGGRCRYCGAPIGWNCLLTEGTGALVGGLLAWRWGASPALLLAATACAGLFLSSLTDLYDRSVHDVVPLASGAAALLLRLLGGTGALVDGLLGVALGFAVIALLIALSRGGMGWGDGTLMAGTGAALGWKLTILALYLGFMIGGVVALLLIALGKVRRKDALPLVPFLALGSVVTLLAGPQILAFIGISAAWPW